MSAGRTGSGADAPRLADRALACLLKARGAESRRLLARHPRAKAIRAVLASRRGDTLFELQEAELQQSESRRGQALDAARIPLPAQIVHWLRRRRTDRLSACEIEIERTAPYWRRIAGLASGAFDDFCVRLGTEVIAHAVSVESRERIVRWLAPLGTAAAHEIADALVERVPAQTVSEALQESWNASFRDALSASVPCDVRERMGLGLLRSLFFRLQPRARAAIRERAASQIGMAIDAEYVGPFYPEGHVREVEVFLTEVLGTGDSVATAGKAAT